MKEKLRAKNGYKWFYKKYNLDEIITGDSFFATGITGDLVKGVEINDNEYLTETLVTHKSTGLKKVIITKNLLNDKLD